jgi:hypothetical protein
MEDTLKYKELIIDQILTKMELGEFLIYEGFDPLTYAIKLDFLFNSENEEFIVIAATRAKTGPGDEMKNQCLKEPINELLFCNIFLIFLYVFVIFIFYFKP